MTSDRARSYTSRLLAIPAVLVAALAGLVASAAAQEPAPTPEHMAEEQAASEAPAEPTLQQQIEELRRQLQILEAKVAAEAAAEAEAEAEKEKPEAEVTANARDGFSLRSSDGRFALKIRGYAQLDGRGYAGETDESTTDTFLVRRARLTLDGTLFERFAFRLMPDFGTNATLLQDAYMEWTFGPAAVVRAGKFKPPIGLERLQSASEMSFVERALPTNLVPNRDLGIQLAGQLAGGKVEYAAGLFNGVVDGGSTELDTNDGKDLAARLWASPWKGTPSSLAGLSFGIGGSTGSQEGTVGVIVVNALPSYRTAGQQVFFNYRSDGTTAGSVVADGTRGRLSPQAAFYHGPFGLLAEYVQNSQEVRRDSVTADLTHRSWQVQGVWILTGENASFRWYAPARAFDPRDDDPEKRGWGGFAVMARYNLFDADDDSFPIFANPASSATEASGWAVGFDWTLQRLIRVMLDYEVTSFEGGAVAGNREDEKVLFTRFQIGW